MIRAEFDELMAAVDRGRDIKHEIPYDVYVDESFARLAKPAAIPL